ncbi:hypothetical protein CPC08DRAFT_418291 [Agrocybe pediades]|nr:hypothetical protein CPC08DRAFT_418291 [Agrocybe pediades]
MGTPYIDFLPNELLEEIFKAGASLPFPVDEEYPGRPLFSKLPPVLLPVSTAISQVCARWRAIALHTPSLWTHIHLSRSLESHRRLRTEIGQSLSWVPIYLVQSAGLLLNVTLDTTRLPAEETIRLISGFSDRWRSFTLLVSHVGSLPSILPSLVSVSVPRLQSFSIEADIYREGIVSYDPLIPFFVTSTPQLATIHLNGVYIAWNELPLANLLNLELYLTSRWPEFPRLREMFRASPMLQQLAIRDDIPTLLRHVQQPYTKPKIELSSLKYLKIQVYRLRNENADVAGLMGLFNMPMLEALAITGIRREEWIAVTRVYDLPLDPNWLSMRAAAMVPSNSRNGKAAHRPLTNSFPFLSSLDVVFTAPPRRPEARTSLRAFR